MSKLEKNGKLKRREFLRTMAVGAAGVAGSALATACAPMVAPGAQRAVEVTRVVEVTAAPAAGAAADGPKTLTVWGSGLDLTQIEKDPKGAGAALIAHRDLVLNKHPGSKIVWEDHGWDEALRQNVVTALLAGTQPDVIVGENFFQSYAALGALLPIDDVMTKEVADNSIIGTHKAAVYNGKNYGLSWISGCFGFEGNPNVMQEAGLEPKIPATWTELEQMAKTITEKGAGKFAGYTLQGPLGFSVGGMFRLAVYLQQLGSTLTKPDDPFAPNFDDPKSFPAWEFVRRMLPYMPPGLAFEQDEGKVYSQLFAGKSAFQMAGSWHVGWAKQSGLKNAIYGSVPIPDGGKPASYVVGNVIYGAMAASKNADMALDWIVASQDKSVQHIVFKSTGRLPSTKSAVEEMLKDSNVDDATKQYGKLLRDSDLGILPQWRKEPNKLNTIWNDLFTAVLTTQTAVADLATDAQKKATEVLTAA